MQTYHSRPRSEAGFTLLETLVALMVVSLVMGATFTAMVHASRLSETAGHITGVNSNLRGAMDVVVRDLTQAGQGLPGLRRAGVPNGDGSGGFDAAEAIVRPYGTLTFRLASSLPAITTGMGIGPNGSDIMTLLAADTSLEDVDITDASADDGKATVTVAASRPLTIANGGAYNVRKGDLVLIRNAGGDVLMTVTNVAGQVITCEEGATDDVLKLNQLGNILGSATNIVGADPDPLNVSVTRVRMVTYYLLQDDASDPRQPMLVRRVNGSPPATVAFAIQNFTLTYDLATEGLQLAGVAMDDDDIVTGNGRCKAGSTARPCSENWIRKVNVVLSARSLQRGPGGAYYTSSLFAQVGMRGLSFRDRY